jgi:murein DD-endopeptidase MepM/ murein hydrolase activator NlpD
VSVDTPGHEASRQVARRATLAQAALARARGGVLAESVGEAPQRARVVPWQTLRLLHVQARLARHVVLCALVALMLCGEVLGAWSSRTGEVHAERLVASAGARNNDRAAAVVVPVSIGPLQLGGSATPLEPIASRPSEVASAYKATHQLLAGETLGAVAERYQISLDTLVWANGLERGDALVEGQLLRIPYVAGIPHVVRDGETAASLAAQFAVPVEAIVAFPANHVGAGLELRPGSELFIPGAQPALPADWLQALGGISGLAARGIEPAGVVREAKTNLRSGPSTEHERLAQLEAGRRLILRARHDDWLEVQLGATRGWVRADMIDASSQQVAGLVVSNDFPAAPARWVWPAQGTVTSRFGARWGGFHNGLDIASRAWTKIYAARTGLVKEAGWCSGYGYCVKLVHDGGFETIYGHLIDQPTVSRGDEVSAGELIGYMGSTYDRAGGGYSTGVHLHLTVLLNGRAVDPLRFLP